MKLATLSDAQRRLPQLVRQARREAIGLTDEAGNLVGVLAGIDADELDNLIVGTRAFQEMIARSRSSLAASGPVLIADLIAEARLGDEGGNRGQP